MENLYTVLIETMIKQGITETSTVEETAKDFSSNNIKRLIISPDFIGVNYHIGESRYKAISAVDRKKIFENSKQEKYVNCLYGLSKPFVCGNIETVLVFTKSGNMPDIFLSEKEFDIRGKYSKDSVLPLYSQGDKKSFVQRELRKHLPEFKNQIQGILEPNEVDYIMQNLKPTASLEKNDALVLKLSQSEKVKNIFHDYEVKTILNLKPVLMDAQGRLEKYFNSFPRFRGIYVYNDSVTMQEFLEILKGKSPEKRLLLKYEVHPDDYYNYRCKEQSSIYGEIDKKIAEKLDKIAESKEIKEPKNVNIVRDYQERLQEVMNRKGFNSLKPYMKYNALDVNGVYENLLGFYLGNLESLYEHCPLFVKMKYRGRNLKIKNVSGFNSCISKLKKVIDIKITDDDKIACNSICVGVERLFLA